MTHDDIRTRRAHLENEITAMLKNFELQCDVRVTGISFGEVQLYLEGNVSCPSSKSRECLINIGL